MSKISFMTQEGLNKIKKELDQLRNTPGYITRDAEGNLLAETNPTKHKQITDAIRNKSREYQQRLAAMRRRIA